MGAQVAAIPMFNDPYNEGEKTDLYDMADPTYHLAAGRESGVGNAMGEAGKRMFEIGATKGNGWLMLAGAGAKVLGGLTNAAFGYKLNKDNINKVKGNIASMKQAGHGFNRLSTNSDLANAMGNTDMGFDFSDSYIGKNGWFNHKATREANKLRTRQNTARGYVTHSFADAASSIDKNKDDMAQINTIAYGGPLDTMGYNDMNALGYGFMSDYLTMKNNQARAKDKVGGFTGVFSTNPFAEGGGIEIKHPGRLTELKKRTGKTEAELWAEGKPEVRKMITFARNARKWQKAYGGYLDAFRNLFQAGGYTGDDDDDKSTASKIGQGWYDNVVAPVGSFLQGVGGLLLPSAPEGGRYGGDRSYDGGGASTGTWTPRVIQPEVERRLRAADEVVTFNEAYAAARKAGKKTFQFDGKTYSTEYDKSNNAERAKAHQKAGSRLGRTGRTALGIEYVRKGTPKQGPLDVRFDYGGPLMHMNNTLFALGGDVQMHGGDYPTGLTHIDEGGSHEENPNEGVQMGVDSQGVPNMVEEGETVFNDYVFSNRIEMDAQTKERFHIGKKRKMTYAAMSKKLEKEATERPNDPISKASLKKQLAVLQEEQERQKQEMEARRAAEEFAAMSPDERELVLREMQRQLQEQDRAAMEEQAMQQQGIDQMAQQQGMQEQMMQQQGYGYPDEQAMMQQQMAQQQMMPQQGAPVGGMGYAYGGRINRFDGGGGLREAIWNSINVHTQPDWEKWAKEHNVELGENFDWSKALENESLKSALGTNNPALQHVLGSGYDYGMFKPSQSTGEVNFNGADGNSYMNAGNWAGANDRERPSATWNDSGDRMYREAIELLKQEHPNNWQSMWDSLDREGLENLFKRTQAYKDTTAWLTDKDHGVDNMLAYLKALSNDPDFTNPSAIKHLEKFIDRKTGQWKEGVDVSNVNELYSQIFGEKSGNAGRLHYPGNFWHTPSILNNPRGTKTLNYVINDDGSVELIETDVPTDWKRTNTYSWQDADNDLTYNYYTRPGYKGPAASTTPSGATGQAKAGANPVDANGNRKWLPKPVHQPTWMRYAGVFGPAVGLGMMGAGIGKPDYSNLDAALEIGRRPTALADWMPVHERQWYTPFDIWSQENRMGNMSAGTDRYLMNNSSPVGTRNAALLANAEQARQGLGALGIQSKEYNDKLNDTVQRFNQSTSLANQQAYDSTSQFNASAMNQGRNVRAQMAMDAAKQRMLMDQNWAQGIYGNVSGLFKGIGDIGRENYQRNMLADMAAQGIFGPMSPSTYISDGFINWEKNPQYQNAEGGKIRRKKNKRRGGLTY